MCVHVCMRVLSRRGGGGEKRISKRMHMGEWTSGEES